MCKSEILKQTNSAIRAERLREKNERIKQCAENKAWVRDNITLDKVDGVVSAYFENYKAIWGKPPTQMNLHEILVNLQAPRFTEVAELIYTRMRQLGYPVTDRWPCALYALVEDETHRYSLDLTKQMRCWWNPLRWL
jgi:adenylate kinase family enzyme